MLGYLIVLTVAAAGLFSVEGWPSVAAGALLLTYVEAARFRSGAGSLVPPRLRYAGMAFCGLCAFGMCSAIFAVGEALGKMLW